MKRWKKIIITVIIIGVVVCMAYAYYVWNKPARNVADEDGIVISATALYDSFLNNEPAANGSFLNKAIQVTGMVNNVKKNQAGEMVVYLQTSDPVFGVNCTLKQEIPVIEKGKPVTFKGVCTGFLSDVVLTNCLLIK